MSLYLVTGGAGFIGSNIVEKLVRQNQRVRVLDNFVTGKRENLNGLLDKIELLEGDIRNTSDVEKTVRGVDFVLHQAALRSVPKSVQNPFEYNDVNVTGTLNLLIACAKFKVKRVVYASSSSVYGNTTHFPQKEEQLPNPISPYATSKLAGEYYCKLFTLLYNLETVSLRYFNVFGPRQDPASQYAAVIPKFITCALKNESPTVDGDGLQSRDFTFVDNVSEANILAAIKPNIAGEVINIACGDSFSVLQILEIINKILNKNIKPKFGPPRLGDVRKTMADIAKLNKLISFDGIIDFEEGLIRAIDWFKDNI